jgi:gliding motility-associated lipoprotein GldD
MSCDDDEDKIYSPKPRGYFRIEFPEKKYRSYDSLPDCRFDVPAYAYVARENRKGGLPDTGKYKGSDPKWINLQFPKYKATVNMTHLTINNNLEMFLEDSRYFAFSKHQIKATGIDETVVIRDSANVYGLVYDIAGNTASSVQFYLTDSTKHFLRGALYFNSIPNIDSLKIVIDFVRKDILQLIKTCEWKDGNQNLIKNP